MAKRIARAGTGLARRRQRDRTTMLLVVGGVVVVGGVAVYLATRPKTATTPSALPPSGAGTGVTRNVMLTPGTPNVTVPASVGDTISISLPTGGVWQAGGNIPTGAPGTSQPTSFVGTSLPITFPYSGPSGSGVTLNWSMPTTGLMTSVITFQTQ